MAGCRVLLLSAGIWGFNSMNFIMFKKSIQTQKSAGFTLIEVLIAMTVFSVGILAVITMQTTGVSGNAKAQTISKATNIAADRMEILMNLSYTSSLLEDPPTSGIGTDAKTDGVDNDGDGSIDEVDEAYTVYDTASDGVDNDNDGTIDEDSEYGNYTVKWRVTTNYPVTNTKNITVIITNSLLSAPVTMTFVRAAAI